MIYDQLMEKMLSHFAGPSYQEEIREAKREFFEQAGIVDDNSDHFEVRMAQFLDWYLFTRELSEDHMTPSQLMLVRAPFEIPEEQGQLFENMSKCHHSLFEFLKIRGRDVYIYDLFENKKIVVQDSNVTAGFNVDEIFEARIIPHEKTYVFCRGFCFHPPEAKKFITKEVKKVRHLDKLQKEALMMRLFKMRYKFEQYKHIRLEFIYTNDSKLKV